MASTYDKRCPRSSYWDFEKKSGLLRCVRCGWNFPEPPEPPAYIKMSDTTYSTADLGYGGSVAGWNMHENIRKITQYAASDYLKKSNEVKPKSTMRAISNMFKKLTDAGTQSLYKAEYINGDLELTDKGVRALRTILFEANKAALIALADEEIAAEETKK